jgi:hypothetical protein
MNKIERETIFAFILGEVAMAGNTASTGTELILHGHVIAKRENGRLLATLAGFPSKLTRQRLNCLMAAQGFARKFWQEDGHQYFGDSKLFRSIMADEWVVIA